MNSNDELRKENQSSLELQNTQRKFFERLHSNKREKKGLLGFSFNESNEEKEREGGRKEGEEWDVQRGKYSQTVYRGHSSGVKMAVYSSDGKSVVSASLDGVVRLWSPQVEEEGERAEERKRNVEEKSGEKSFQCNSQVSSVCWEVKSNRYVLCGTESGKVKLWEVLQNKIVGDVFVSSAYPKIKALAVNPTKNSFVVASEKSKGQGSLTLWDLKTLNCTRHFEIEPPSSLNCVSFNHNGNLLAVGGEDGIVRVYDISETCAILGWKVWEGRGETKGVTSSKGVTSVSFSEDEMSVLCVSSSGALSKWSVHEVGSVLQNYLSPPLSPFSPPSNLALESSGKRFVVGFNDTAYLYSSQDSHHLLTVTGHSAPITHCDWNPFSPHFLTSSLDSTVRISSIKN